MDLSGKLAEWWDPIFNDLLAVKVLRGIKEAWSSVKVTKATVQSLS